MRIIKTHENITDENKTTHRTQTKPTTNKQHHTKTSNKKEQKYRTIK